jgi:hypothetical protein
MPHPQVQWATSLRRADTGSLNTLRILVTRRVDEIEAAVTIARYLDYWKRL